MAEPLEQVQRAFTAYTVERELGSGGMATVYLAHDRKHDRKVAIKVLHAELAAVLGAERFLHEIRVTANLQHPHILGLIDSGILAEDAPALKGRPYYVMPYVDGESLRQRLVRDRQLPVADAVRIAADVASALDYAHRRGVVHRDIKPENLLLHDGSALVADFGIALAITQAGDARMTQTGLSLGTPSYMSPEQAMGERTITARSDIYSLGAVTYEMLSGEPPFTGPTVQAIVARVMTEEPRSLTAQRRSVPPHVAAAVFHALEKVPADRFGSAHEFAEALKNPSFTLSTGVGAVVGREQSSRRSRVLYAVTALAMLTTATALWGWMRPPLEKPVVRYRLAFDSAEAMAQSSSERLRLALSPDGSHLAYVGGPGAQLLIRPRHQLHATAVPGTAGANSLFFSPDGRRVGFVSTKRILQIVGIDGGLPIAVADTLIGLAGASWGRDGFIYADGLGLVSLVRVEATPGAVPTWFTVLDTASGESDHMWPDVLPNGKGVLFTAEFKGKNARGKTFAICVAETRTGKHRQLVNDATYARYAASGHLLYVTTSRTLMMVPFDQNSMTITGKPTALAEDMRAGGLGADLAVSTTGTLVYATGAGEDKTEFVSVARDGTARSVDPDWQGRFGSPALSPDGKRLAVGENSDIWIKELERGPRLKLTLEGKENYDPGWTPDGRSVTFSSNAEGSFDLWTQRADGSAPAVLQLREKRAFFSARWSPDGKWLIFRTYRFAADSGDILGIRPGIDTTPVPLVATRFTEVSQGLSPDGRWLAYTSNESGRYEIYVVPFPNTRAAKWAVSTRGGTEPRWSHRGRELFYRDLAGDLVAVEVETNPTFSLGRSTALFAAGGFRSDEREPQYVVSSDDQRFLMLRPVATGSDQRVIVVENWFEELKGKAPQ